LYALGRGTRGKDVEVARTVRRTESATQDLEGGAEFIARGSQFHAAALVRDTRAAAQSLQTLAERGRMVPKVVLECEAEQPVVAGKRSEYIQVLRNSPRLPTWRPTCFPRGSEAHRERLRCKRAAPDGKPFELPTAAWATLRDAHKVDSVEYSSSIKRLRDRGG
jgi:plasmid stabilization system protein ParE